MKKFEYLTRQLPLPIGESELARLGKAGYELVGFAIYPLPNPTGVDEFNYIFKKIIL